MRRVLFILITLGLSSLSCGPALAHHGGAAYDSTKPTKLTGTVTDFEWANPHCQIYFDVKDDKGGVTHWNVEILSIGKLSRAGWTRSSMKPGDQIIVNINPARNGNPIGIVRNGPGAVVVNGKELSTEETPF